MTARITVTYLEIDGCDQFTISVLRPDQTEKNFIFEDGVPLMSKPFDQLMSCIFNTRFRSRRINESLISIGLPSKYKEVQAESRLCEHINDYDKFMGRFDRILSEVSESIKEFRIKNPRVAS